MFGYDDLTKIMDRILDIWERLEDAGVVDDTTGDLFESLVGHLGMTREHTGWGGVPGEYTRPGGAASVARMECPACGGGEAERQDPPDRPGRHEERPGRTRRPHDH